MFDNLEKFFSQLFTLAKEIEGKESLKDTFNSLTDILHKLVSSPELQAFETLHKEIKEWLEEKEAKLKASPMLQCAFNGLSSLLQRLESCASEEVQEFKTKLKTLFKPKESDVNVEKNNEQTHE